LQLDISRNNLAYYGQDISGVKALADALSVSASVTSLSLGRNSLGDEDVTAICEAVQSNKETKLASLDIQYNRVGPAGAKSVAAMVAVIASVSRLDARVNRLGDEGEAILREAVKEKPGFELLL